MGITIDKPGASFDDDPKKLVADRALWADAALTKLCEAGDPDASIQLASRAGKVLLREHVARLGLSSDSKGRVVQKSAEVEPKKAAKPGEDKAAKSGRNKSIK